MSFKANIAGFLNSILEHYRLKESGTALAVEGFAPDSPYALRLNSYFKSLFCIEMEGLGNAPTYLTEQDIKDLLATARNDDAGFLVWSIVKKGEFRKNYIWTFSEAIANKVSFALRAKKMLAIDMLDALYDLYGANDYFVQKNRAKKNLTFCSEDEYGSLPAQFNAMVQDAVYGNLKDTVVYQGYRYQTTSGIASGGRVPLYELLKLPFEGVIFTFLGMSKVGVESALSRRIWQARFDGKHKAFEVLKERYTQRDTDLAVLNTVAVLKKGFATNIPTEIGNCLKTQFVRKKLFATDILKKTPILSRDFRFDRLVTPDFLKEYIGTVQKTNSERPDMSGIDATGGFVNYGLKNPAAGVANSRPHLLFLGPTGTGKTVQLCYLTKSKIGLDLLTGKADYIDTNYLRLFDIKKSLKIIADRAELDPYNDVKKLDANLNNFAYNLLNIDSNGDGIDDNELAYAADLLSIIIETQSGGKDGGLSGAEDGLFKTLMREIYNTKRYTGPLVQELKKTHPEIYNELRAEGYSDNLNVIEIPLPHLEHFKKPLLKDLINYLSIYIENYQITSIQKEVAESLQHKLSGVDALQYFSQYDRIDLKTGKIIYLDFDSVKDIPEYVPIFWAIFYKIYTADKKRQENLRVAGKPRPEIMYIFEEVYNLFIVKSFEPLLAKLTNEARSYDIIIGFATQLPEHIPPYAFKQIETKFCLFPGEKDKPGIIKGIVMSAGLENQPDTIKIMEATPPHTMAVIYEHGAFMLKFKITPEEMKLLETSGKVSLSE